MKQVKALLLTFSLIVSPLSAPLAADTGKKYSAYKADHSSEYYARASLGFPFYRKIKKSFEDDTAKFMPHSSIALGGRYKKFGAEVEGGYIYFKMRSTMRSNIASRSSLKSKTLFLNLFFYPTLFMNKVRPYVGAGVGRAFNEMGCRYGYLDGTSYLVATGIRYSNTAFQGIVGAEYIVNNKFSLLADVRYIRLGKFKQKHNNVFEDAKSAEMLSIATLMIGAKYKFN